jgi:hypothetical protein
MFIPTPQSIFYFRVKVVKNEEDVDEPLLEIAVSKWSPPGSPPLPLSPPSPPK